MEKWELLELKRKLIKYNKISIGLYYAKIELVRNELSRRKKKEQVVNKQYLKKKGEIYNDEY